MQDDLGDQGTGLWHEVMLAGEGLVVGWAGVTTGPGPGDIRGIWSGER